MFKRVVVEKPHVQKSLSHENNGQPSAAYKMNIAFPVCLDEEHRRPLTDTGGSTRQDRRGQYWEKLISVSLEGAYGGVMLRIKKGGK